MVLFPQFQFIYFNSVARRQEAQERCWHCCCLCSHRRFLFVFRSAVQTSPSWHSTYVQLRLGYLTMHSLASFLDAQAISFYLCDGWVTQAHKCCRALCYRTLFFGLPYSICTLMLVPRSRHIISGWVLRNDIFFIPTNTGPLTPVGCVNSV
jgi:hypothetical protein